MSMAIRSKGVSTIGSGTSGAGTLRPGAVFWHSGQDLHISATSLNTVGQ